MPVALEASDAASTVVVDNAAIPLRTPLVAGEIARVREALDVNVFEHFE